WMNLSDKQYVALFESDEYSKLMAEVSALQMNIKKSVDTQMESALSVYPVATRTEMDELYKTIYELKKHVRQLEKMLEVDSMEVTPAKPAAKTTAKTATKSSTKK